MIYKLGNPQNFITNNGYCIGELEMSTMVVTTHLQAENYNKLFFTHGFASRGLLHIKGDATPAQLKAFRSQWYAQVSGNENSWRTPIIAGVDDVKWIQLAANNREMEYSNYVDHIIRTLCAIFAISPVEIGFDYLTKGQGQGGLGQEDNDTKIQQSQVRGLKPLLVWIETIINEDIIPNVDEILSEKYKFEFVGLEAESKAEELERHQAEIAVRATLNDIRDEAGLDPILAGEVVGNEAWLTLMMQTHTIGQIREYLFGYAGDSENPKFDYIADQFWFQQRQIVDPEMKAEQDAMMMMQAGAMPPGEEGMPPGQGEEPQGGVSPEEAAMEEEAAADAGGESNPFGKAKKKDMDLIKSEMSQKKQWYLGKKLDKRLEKVRKQFLGDYKMVEKKMLDEIFEVVKEDVNGESDKDK